MKRIILVRHAKSDWPEGLDDFDRPLAKSGQNDAKLMSEFLKNNNVSIDHFVSSPALRTRSTCEIFNEQYQINCSFAEPLYHPSEDNILSVIYNLDNRYNTVALFSHNNGISNFANAFTNKIIHMPTCGTFAFDIECDSWSEFEGAKKNFAFFYEPKKIMK